MPPLGIIFDLDGTLVDSQLDFELMRREMELPDGVPILETIQSLPAPRAAVCHEILARHESEGARRATVMPGVQQFLAQLDNAQIPRAVVTRNSRRLAIEVIERLVLNFDLVIAREDAPAKPDPAAIWRICDLWGASPHQVLVIGDYWFDIEAGRRAGARTVLYTAGRDARGLPEAELADELLDSFHDAHRFLAG